MDLDLFNDDGRAKLVATELDEHLQTQIWCKLSQKTNRYQFVLKILDSPSQSIQGF